MQRGLRTCYYMHWAPCTCRLTTTLHAQNLFRRQSYLGNWYQAGHLLRWGVDIPKTCGPTFVRQGQRKHAAGHMFRASPVTPYGFMDVALTPICDTPDWSIETLDPVSRIRRFGSPSISNETVGDPCSSRTEAVGLSTAFPWMLRWRELPSLSPLTRFPGYVFPVCLPVSLGKGFPRRKSGNASNARSVFTFQASFGFLSRLISQDIPWRNALALHIQRLSSALVWTSLVLAEVTDLLVPCEVLYC